MPWAACPGCVPRASVVPDSTTAPDAGDCSMLFAMVPPLVLGIGHIHSTEALIIVGSVLVVHLIALNVLYPKIVGSRVSLNPLAVTLALLLWGFLWGAMGLILAVPVTAAMKIIFDHVESLRAYGAWLGE